MKKVTKFKNIPPDTMNNSKFPDELKLAEVTVTFKKDDPTKSKNYRPVSILPTVSKVFEKIMHRRMSIFVENFLSLYMCEYRKSFSTQKALLSLIETWKKYLIERDMGAQYLWIF